MMTTLLIIDDKESLRAEIAEVLTLENYDVMEAEDGLQGVQVAKEHQPDLILCDLMLPHLDGFGVIQELSNHTDTMSIPVILLSARAEKDTIKHGLALGAKAYITKPFALADLLMTIQMYLP